MEQIKLTQEQQDKIIKQVEHTMKCEKMSLTKQDIQNGKDILQ